MGNGREGMRGMPLSTLLPSMGLDALVIVVAVFAAYMIRFEGFVPGEFGRHVVQVLLVSEVLFIASFAVFRLYSHVLRYAGVSMYVSLAISVAVVDVMLVALDIVYTTVIGSRPVPFGVAVMVGVFVFIGASAWRSTARTAAYFGSRSARGGLKTIIIGAGDAGSLLLRDIQSQPDLGLDVVGFLDDDPHKIGRSIAGVRVLDETAALHRVVAEHDIGEVFVAIPSATAAQRRRVLDACASAAVRTRVVASPVAGSVGLRLADLKNVKIEDLLGRDSVKIDTARITDQMRDKVVAITGAAGSIGRELARQVVSADPARVLLVDIDESRLYETYLELAAISSSAPMMCLCDIRDKRRLGNLFQREKPSIVLHSAAYKHVPMMELVPEEAIRTNIGGTANVINSALSCGAERFVLISTDKAVEPRNIMGLTKFVAELLMLDAKRRGLGACAVRFGNVLGSRGSVVPIFEEQIRRGGPLRVTHAEATRYFMTIPEAAGLVLEASSLSAGGEIFVLDMGEPVKIMDLARKMIALNDPRVSIDIIGLRPGEKLHEVLTYQHESLVTTTSHKILRLDAVQTPSEELGDLIERLVEAAEKGRLRDVLEILTTIVPEATWVGGLDAFRGVIRGPVTGD